MCTEANLKVSTYADVIYLREKKKKHGIMTESQKSFEAVNQKRDAIIGLDSGPEPQFPLRIGGQVLHGFGRGSKEVCSNFFIFSY